jgi:hypothetical protein
MLLHDKPRPVATFRDEGRNLADLIALQPGRKGQPVQGKLKSEDIAELWRQRARDPHDREQPGTIRHTVTGF